MSLVDEQAPGPREILNARIVRNYLAKQPKGSIEDQAIFFSDTHPDQVAVMPRLYLLNVENDRTGLVVYDLLQSVFSGLGGGAAISAYGDASHSDKRGFLLEEALALIMKAGVCPQALSKALSNTREWHGIFNATAKGG